MTRQPTPSTSSRSLAALAVFIVLAFSAAAVGALFPPGEWYETIAKPAWTPPGWLFGPVWTVLYLMIGISGWLLWRSRPTSRQALVLWAAQLGLNAVWSPVFFGLEAPGAALVVIVALLIAIGLTVIAARRVRPAAGWLLTPYLLWVSFATALNGAIWSLN